MKSYQLYIFLNEDVRVQIGKLGVFSFPKGNYIYTGSAKRNIEKRIERHLSSNKKLHWHIDYLLENSHTKIVTTRKTNFFECHLNKNTAGNKIILGFGSSDCKENCGSHLKYVS